MFVSVNMKVTKDIYKVDEQNFVYQGSGESIGGHSIVCCGYDEESKMFIMQNHWGTIWGLKGFFLCPYDVWKRQCNIFCWYERKIQQKRRRTKHVVENEDEEQVDSTL